MSKIDQKTRDLYLQKVDCVEVVNGEGLPSPDLVGGIGTIIGFYKGDPIVNLRKKRGLTLEAVAIPETCLIHSERTYSDLRGIGLISEFRDENAFLSNFFPCKVFYNGLMYENSEAAYQAQKCPERSWEFTSLGPSQAKKLGRKVRVRDDWNLVKVKVMYEVVTCKFFQNPELADLLKDTGEVKLEEGNYWGDTFWGVCKGEGQNRLGRILMRVRGMLRNYNFGG